MANEDWYRQNSLDQRQSETWDGSASAFSTTYDVPRSGEQAWPVDFQGLDSYCAIGVIQDRLAHGLPVTMAMAGPVPDQEAYLPTDFYHGIHGDQYLSRQRRYNTGQYAARTVSMPGRLHGTFESSPIPFVPRIKEEERFYDGSSYRLKSADTCTSYEHKDDTDSSWSDQSDRGSESIPVSRAMQAPSHPAANRAPPVSDHTYFDSSRRMSARSGPGVDDFAQPKAGYTLQCACGLIMKGAHAKGNLARHQRSRGCTAYAESRRCQCPECPQVFWRSDALLNHRRKKHEAPPCRPNRLRRYKGPRIDRLP
ncbi:hypothetical protein P171DRAFT_478020 [Karstenula rhodostoma CBS 690.94]|uniref:C2H2-type domain-containing protein n=1 Tax=Karstenula rhodostoma CBS 690.94 TaxID=1392251 RepID=A0A9P4P4Q8_9PLEO|nr:hypothetical protein P171DRAFT_478020 [Karstenula rhodostoma CBS 690.94]